MEIIERVKELVANYLEEHNMDLVEITYKRQQGTMVLRLLVDTPEGITLNECEELNNYLSTELDKEDVIGEHYLLEVASPGLDRPIVSDKDFERVLGKVIEVTTYEMIDARKTHEGSLIGMDKDKIVIESHGVSTVIPRVKVAVARRKVEV